MSRTWEADFVAVSAAIGEPEDAVSKALGAVGLERAGELATRLRTGTRAARAIALAKGLAEIGEDVERMELR